MTSRVLVVDMLLSKQSRTVLKICKFIFDGFCIFFDLYFL